MDQFFPSIAERLAYCISEIGLTQAEICRRAGITDPVILNRWVKGTRKPQAESLRPLKEAFDINPDWILYQEGHPFTPKKQVDFPHKDEGESEEPKTIEEMREGLTMWKDLAKSLKSEVERKDQEIERLQAEINALKGHGKKASKKKG